MRKADEPKSVPDVFQLCAVYSVHIFNSVGSGTTHGDTYGEGVCSNSSPTANLLTWVAPTWLTTASKVKYMVD